MLVRWLPPQFFFLRQPLHWFLYAAIDGSDRQLADLSAFPLGPKKDREPEVVIGQDRNPPSGLAMHSHYIW